MRNWESATFSNGIEMVDAISNVSRKTQQLQYHDRGARRVEK